MFQLRTLCPCMEIAEVRRCRALNLPFCTITPFCHQETLEDILA